MPLFMDEHRGIEGLTASMVAEVHRMDLAVQERYGVRFRGRWFDETTGTLFCLAEAPTRESVEAVHRAAHGLRVHRIVRVEPAPRNQGTAVRRE